MVQAGAAGREVTGVAGDLGSPALVKSNRPFSMIRRPSTVEEVANMIVHACSTEATATTGAALRVDGGVVDSLA